AILKAPYWPPRFEKPITFRCSPCPPGGMVSASARPDNRAATASRETKHFMDSMLHPHTLLRCTAEHARSLLLTLQCPEMRRLELGVQRRHIHCLDRGPARHHLRGGRARGRDGRQFHGC